VLTLTMAMFAYGGVQTVYAEPQFGQGCQCHNNGIALWFNGTGHNEFSAVTIAPSATFVINATSANYAATGVVPALQQWMMNMSDTAKFTISPQSVSLSSSSNVSKIKVNSTITAFYKITAPAHAGTYHLVFYAEGTTNSIAVLVVGQTSTSTSTSAASSQTGTTTTSASSQTSSQTSPPPTSTTTTTSTTTKTTRAAPDVTYYSSELALIVVGFSLFVVIAMWRYRKS